MAIKEEDIIRKKEKSNDSTPEKGISVEKILVENFVSLQKVMTNLALKFDSLAEQMSKLLELFEISAKSLVERGYPDEEDKKIMEKLDSLLEHNKVIAKGIALLHERENAEEETPAQQFEQQTTPSMLNIPKPIPKIAEGRDFPKPMPVPKPEFRTGE